MPNVNEPNSQNDVLNTATFVLAAFEHMVRQEMTNLSVVYDEQLSYETGVKQFLANNDFNDINLKPIPIFIYNRTVMLNSIEGAGKRFKNMTGCVNVTDTVVGYSITQGEFDIQFLYVTKNTEMSDKFEVVYNSDEGITGSKEIVLNIPEIGDFTYYLKYEDLSEIKIEDQDVYYKGVVGTIKVRGFYFTFSGTGKAIKTINQRIIASLDIPNRIENEILSDITIV